METGAQFKIIVNGKPRSYRDDPAIAIESGKVPLGKPAFQPYWGKPAVRNDRGDRGNVVIIEARSVAGAYPTERHRPRATRSGPRAPDRRGPRPGHVHALRARDHGTPQPRAVAPQASIAQ